MTKLGQLYEKEKLNIDRQEFVAKRLDIVDIMEALGLTEAEILTLKDKQSV